MLFSDSLLDVSAGRSRRGWSSLTAYAAEAVVVAVIVFFSVWNTQALPRVSSTVFTMIGAPTGPAPKQPAGPKPHGDVQRPIPRDPNVLVAPIRIPSTIDRRPDPPSVDAVDVGDTMPGIIPGNGHNGTGLISGLLPPPVAARPEPPAPKPAPSRINVSQGVQSGFLMRQVQPMYPSIARTARVEGTVVLAAVISREGVVEGLHAVSGPPMLIPAAIEAVRQWRYRPYLLNNQPVEVETQISVIFTLAK